MLRHIIFTKADYQKRTTVKLYKPLPLLDRKFIAAYNRLLLEELANSTLPSSSHRSYDAYNDYKNLVLTHSNHFTQSHVLSLKHYFDKVIKPNNTKVNVSKELTYSELDKLTTFYFGY